MSGMKLHARQEGNGADVIALHGLLGSQENLGVIKRGLKDTFKVHSLDLRNHGRSPHNETMNYSIMADDVLGYMDEQGLKTVYLVGHSIGGKVAMTLALKAPERVSKLAVIDIAPVMYPPKNHEHILTSLSSINLESVKSRSDVDAVLATIEPDKDIRQFLLKNLYRNESGHYCWRVNLEAIITNYLDLRAEVKSDDRFMNETIFIKGEHSDYILPEYTDRILKLFPLASVMAIPEAGHWVHAQQPKLLIDALFDFFG